MFGYDTEHFCREEDCHDDAVTPDENEEKYTVGTYDDNGKPFYFDVTSEEHAKENADIYCKFRFVKFRIIIGKTMYKDREATNPISVEETRKPYIDKQGVLWTPSINWEAPF